MPSILVDYLCNCGMAHPARFTFTTYRALVKWLMVENTNIEEIFSITERFTE